MRAGCKPFFCPRAGFHMQFLADLAAFAVSACTADYTSALMLQLRPAFRTRHARRHSLAFHNLTPIRKRFFFNGQKHIAMQALRILLGFDARHLLKHFSDCIRAGKHLDVRVCCPLPYRREAADTLELFNDGIHIHACAQRSRYKAARGFALTRAPTRTAKVCLLYTSDAADD